MIKINKNFFNKIDTEEKAYFLGFLYADGYNNTDRNSVALSLKEDDKEILEKYSEKTDIIIASPDNAE